MATGERIDPFGAFQFLVEINGISRGSFQECSGLDASIEVTEYGEGAYPTARKLPGQTKYSNIVLKRGATNDGTGTELWNWFNEGATGAPRRESGSIIAVDRVGAEMARWNFVQAWPTKYEAPSFNATGSDIAIETLELAHEGLVRA